MRLRIVAICFLLWYSFGLKAQITADIADIFVFPNPTEKYTSIRFYLSNEADLHVKLLDPEGKEVYSCKSYTHSVGYHSKMIILEEVMEGNYTYSIETTTGVSKQGNITFK